MPAVDDGDEEYEDFTSYIAARREDKGRAPGFRLDGETFVCEPVLRAGVLLDTAVRTVEIGTVPAYIGFLEDVLLPDSWERFAPKLRSRDQSVDDQLIEQLVEKIVEDYTGRPTQEPASSASTSSASGRKSKAGSTPKAKRR